MAKNRKLGASKERRTRAIEMRTAGASNRAIAKELGVGESTVCRWFKEPQTAQKAHEAHIDATENARRILRDSATEAADALRANLKADAASDRTTAAKDILDRVGILKGVRHEVEVSSGPDLSKLGEEDLLVLDEILRKTKT